MESADTRKESSWGGPSWPKPFIAAVLFGCILFLSSGYIGSFSEARVLLSFDFSLALLFLLAVELAFRGEITKRAGALWAFPAFLVFSLALAYSGGFEIGPGLVLFLLAYGAVMALLRMREDAWACALASWFYVCAVAIAKASPYFATVVLSLFMLSLALYWKMRGRGGLYLALGELGVKKESLARNVAIGVGATLFIFVAYAPVSLLVYAAGANDLGKVNEKAKAFPGFVDITAVFLAPFSEEILFRGLLFPMLGVIPSSILFGLSHVFYGSWLEVAFAFSIGFFYCWLCKKTGSLVPAIVSHALFNAISLFVMRSL